MIMKSKDLDFIRKKFISVVGWNLHVMFIRCCVGRIHGGFMKFIKSEVER